MLKRNNIYLQSYLKNDQLRTYVGKMQEQTNITCRLAQFIKARLLPKSPISFFVEEQRLYCFIVSVKEKASSLFGR